jgi:hypothetical protein
LLSLTTRWGAMKAAVGVGHARPLPGGLNRKKK